MSRNAELARNAAGRMVLTEINDRPATPFMGVGKSKPTDHKAAPPITAWTKS